MANSGHSRSKRTTQTSRGSSTGRKSIRTTRDFRFDCVNQGHLKRGNLTTALFAKVVIQGTKRKLVIKETALSDTGEIRAETNSDQTFCQLRDARKYISPLIYITNV